MLLMKDELITFSRNLNYKKRRNRDEIIYEKCSINQWTKGVAFHDGLQVRQRN